MSTSVDRMKNEEDKNKVTFDEALDEAGFGLYSYMMLSLAGVVVISVVCIAYSGTMIVPTSACELETTTAQRGAMAAVPVVGMIIGALVWGYLADVFGRKLTLLISLISGATVNAVASISVNWIMLMVLQLVATFLASGQYSMAMTILSESVPRSKQNVTVLLVGSIFLLSQGIMAALAIPIIPLTFSYELPALGIYWNSWRTLLLVYSGPSIISAIWLSFMYESPKFLFAKGRESEAISVLKKIYKMNHLVSEKKFNVKGILMDTTINAGSSSMKDQILPLFKSPLLKNTIILTILFLFQQVSAFLVWLPTITNQFIQILNTGTSTNLTLCDVLGADVDIPLDPDAVPCSLNITSLIMVVGIAAVQSVINALISIIINRTGRRNMVIFISALCGVSGIIVNLVPNTIGSAVMFFIFLLGIITFGLFTAIVVALFPTNVRALAVSFTMTGNRIGTFASVQILNVVLQSNCEVGFYVYSALVASSAFIAALLVDDRFPIK